MRLIRCGHCSRFYETSRRDLVGIYCPYCGAGTLLEATVETWRAAVRVVVIDRDAGICQKHAWQMKEYPGGDHVHHVFGRAPKLIWRDDREQPKSLLLLCTDCHNTAPPLKLSYSGYAKASAAIGESEHKAWQLVVMRDVNLLPLRRPRLEDITVVNLDEGID